MLDAKIIRWASQRKRIIARSKLLEMGMSARTIDHRLKTGWLHRECPGVYAVGTPATHAYERAMAAVTACGKGSLLAGEGALAHWGFVDKWPRKLTILTPNNRRPKGLKVHRSATLTNKDRRVYNGVPVTSPARALLDAAVFLGGRTLMRVVNDALHTRHVKRHHLKEICELHPNHPGVKALRPFWDTTDGATRADWEDDFPTWCVKRGMPRPTIGYKLGRFTVDAIFLAERLIVELDGWDSTAAATASRPTATATPRPARRSSDGANHLVSPQGRVRPRGRPPGGILEHRGIEVAALDAYKSQNVA